MIIILSETHSEVLNENYKDTWKETPYYTALQKQEENSRTTEKAAMVFPSVGQFHKTPRSKILTTETRETGLKLRAIKSQKTTTPKTIFTNVTDMNTNFALVGLDYVLIA